MTKAVFTHAEGSKYDDLPTERYHFPRTYLRAVERAAGDWIVYYEPRRVEAGSERAGGRQVYFAVAFVDRIERDPRRDDHFYAIVRDYLGFPLPQPFRSDRRFFESGLRRDGGATNKGAFGRAVRSIPDHEFAAILAAGFGGVRDDLAQDDWAAAALGRLPDTHGFAEDAALFLGKDAAPAERPVIERLAARPFRDAAFARGVKAAYGDTCALTGLRILNGGGRPEVQAAHIRPVHAGGPDAIQNGLALSGTAHWMFDRGLVSVDEDFSILLARDRLPPGATRLLAADRRLILPRDAAPRPHPGYLRFHREQVFRG